MSKITVSVMLTLALSITSLSANSQNIAESLMKLRAEVEKLDNEIADEKYEYKSYMKSLLRQKDDLEAIISRENLKIKQIQQELSKVQKEIKEAGKNSQGLKPLLLDALALLQTNIQNTLPFKTTERLADVAKIKDQITQDLVTPQKGLVLVWNAFADSIRMSKENGIFKQTITLSGQDRLAEVARIGTVMMYFKTPDETVGYVTKDHNGWFYKEVVSKKEQEQILSLFDAFKKQIRTGFFTLPDAIVTREAH